MRDFQAFLKEITAIHDGFELYGAVGERKKRVYLPVPRRRVLA